MRPTLALLSALLLASPAFATVPNHYAMAQQGAPEAVPPASLEGMFEGEFGYFLTDQDRGAFTIVLRQLPDGGWSGMVRDHGGPQAQVTATFDGLSFQMSKDYGPTPPEGYARWVYYTGTLKRDPISGKAYILGVWSIPGDSAAAGLFTIQL
jgi:hypothetical protein